MYKEKSNRNFRLLFSFVTSPGFKPGTPTSVVWYSIQLSYEAIPFLWLQR